MNHIRKRRAKKHASSRKAAVIAVIVFIAIALLAVVSLGGRSGPNLTESDIYSVLGVSYTTVMSNNVTSFYGASGLNGYLSASVSEFSYNTTDFNTSRPSLITSIIYVMKNNTFANRTEQSISFVSSFPSNPAAGRIYNGSSELQYTYKNQSTLIHNIFTIQALNATPSRLNTLIQYPVYEYTASFLYGNVVGVVTANGHVNIDPNVTLSLSELLFRHLVDAGPAS